MAKKNRKVYIVESIPLIMTSETQTPEEALKLALNRVEELERKLAEGIVKKARLVSTKTANSFHIAVSQLFDAETLAKKYSEFIISNSDEEVVFSTEMRQKLILDIKAVL